MSYICFTPILIFNLLFLLFATTQDTVGDIDTEKMEQEMSAYVTALAAAKDNPTEEFLKAVTEARLRLQAFVL